jgi:hypothetical protein
MGTKVKFLVWPALFLHEGGALISKGVLQIVITCEFNVKLNLVSSCKFVHHIHTRTHREKEKNKKEIV